MERRANRLQGAEPGQNRNTLLIPRTREWLLGFYSPLWSGIHLAEVRHGMNVKRPKSFGISSGCWKVCTTCGKRFQTFWQTEAELVQQGFLFGCGFGNPAQADLASIRRGQHDVRAL